MGKVITVTSGKGGTGKTMFTANIGVMLAMKGHKTIVVDLDNGMRNLDIFLGMENQVIYNITNILEGECKISQAVLENNEVPGLSMIAASSARDTGDITPVHIQVLCDRLKEEFEYVILDTPTGMGDGVTNAALASDMAVIIIETDIAAIRGGEMMDSYLKELGVEKRYMLLNKVRLDLMSEGLVPDLKESTEALRIPVLGAIQSDDNIYVFSSRGIPIVLKKGTYIEENFSDIADKIISL